MGRSDLCRAALAIAGMSLGIAPAAAQFGGMFDDPPRPSVNIPNRPPARQPVRPPEPPPPATSEAEPAGPGIAPPVSIQSQPLPPPPGAAAEPQPAALPPGAPPDASPLPGLPPGQRQPRGTPQPANTNPQPGDEIVTAPPPQKIPNPTAVFSGLDKITGRITSFDVAINETVQFGALQVTPRACYTRPPTETPNTDAFVEVDEVTLQGEVKRIFTGWMFAASPGLHGVEHPIYDVWLTDCKGGTPTGPVADAQPQPAPAAAPARPPQRQTQPRQQRQPGVTFQAPR
jgi:hypothetical protein